MTTIEPTDLRPLTATLIARYAERYNAAFADGAHAVTSPLGAWLLLALVAPAAEGDVRARLEEVLGTTADDAFARATGDSFDDAPSTPVPVRHAQLRFDRPYAVVTVARADGSARSVPREAFAWHGIPVFSAWVAEPSEATD